ncbi:MAG: Calx-beta domain-containing protein [Pyrinomonadaceae bacterium]
MRANTRLVGCRNNSAARTLRSSAALFLAVLLVLGAAQPNARAASDDLDPLFGVQGKVITDFSNFTDEAHDVAVQSDGKIIAVGVVTPPVAFHDFFGVVRYNASQGSLDTTFGTGGRVTTDFGPSVDTAEGVAIQADGKIVVVGTSFDAEDPFGDRDTDFALARYNTDGSLDTTFGTGGKVKTDIFGSPDLATDVLIQPDGKIVVVGSSHGLSVARYNTNGSPDTSFGFPLGFVRANFTSDNVAANAVALQGDGKIVVAGVTRRPSGSLFQFTLARFNPTGPLDSSFDGDGFAVVDFTSEGSAFDRAEGVAVQPDGNIVAVGTATLNTPSGACMVLVRLKPDGSLDPAFAGGGKVVTRDFLGLRSVAHDLVLQPDGKIVVAGSAFDINTEADFAVSRFNADGSPDQNFGSGGKIRTDFLGGQDIAFAVALQPGRGIVLAGLTTVLQPKDFALARYSPSSATSPTSVQFGSASYSASESLAASIPARVFVTRTGDISGTTTVEYSTADGSATQKSDYTAAFGSLTFAPGEASKFFDVLITQEGFARGNKVAHLFLSDPSGATLGARSGVELFIADNDGADTPTNPIDDSTNFVSQHYHDFLNRLADDDGLNFWVNEIELCGADAACREVKRVNVSAAFFLSTEFQESGFYAIRLQRVAFGRKSEAAATRLSYRQFIHDARQLGEGVVVGQAGSEQRIEENRQAYAERVVSEPEFTARFPESLTAAQYADALYTSAGVTPTAAERQEAVTAFGAGGTAGRVAALRKVVESASVRNAEFNAAFVLMQYFGYLRRSPTDAPDVDDTGYQFWFAKLNQFGGNFQNAEIVKAFINAEEVRHRFGL